jgi:hypothetical protein
MFLTTWSLTVTKNNGKITPEKIWLLPEISRQGTNRWKRTQGKSCTSTDTTEYMGLEKITLMQNENFKKKQGKQKEKMQQIEARILSNLLQEHG